MKLVSPRSLSAARDPKASEVPLKLCLVAQAIRSRIVRKFAGFRGSG